MEKQLYVFAKITPKSQFKEQAKEALVGIVDKTRSEDGCYQFDLFEGEKGDESLYLYEKWENHEALAKHYEMSYTKSVFESYKDWLSKPVEINKFYSVV